MLDDYIENEAIIGQILTFDEEVKNCKQVDELALELPVVKTILFAYAGEKGTEYVLGIVEGSRRTSLTKLEALVKGKKMRLASAEEVFNVTGYEVGAVPPISIFGTKTYVDTGVLAHAWVLAGGGTKFSLLKIQTSEILRCAYEASVADISEEKPLGNPAAKK
mgnify:FL=1